MIICEVPIGGSSQHLLAYRSPPVEQAHTLEPEPEAEPEGTAAAPPAEEVDALQRLADRE